MPTRKGGVPIKLSGFKNGTIIGLTLGIAVTLHSQKHPSSPFWVKRVPGTRLRYTNMPVGGTVAAVVAVILRRAGLHMAGSVAAGLAIGASVGAIGTGLLTLLPAEDVQPDM